MIYLSTGGFSTSSPKDIIARFNDKGITEIELSGGIYSMDCIECLQSLKKNNKFLVHNYFPVPKVPFVFNLASLSQRQYDESIAHAESCIHIASELGSRFYSFHAGFMIDLEPSELGRPIQEKNVHDKECCLERFIHAVKYLSEVATRCSVELLIENNVLSAANVKRFGKDIFIFSSYEDGLRVMDSTPDNVNLLIDVAHLNVSANSLGFSRVKFLESLQSWIRGYHLSDNDGLSDQNLPFSRNSWYWPYLIRGLDYYTVEVYDESIDRLHEQICLARTIIGIPMS